MLHKEKSRSDSLRNKFLYIEKSNSFSIKNFSNRKFMNSFFLLLLFSSMKKIAFIFYGATIFFFFKKKIFFCYNFLHRRIIFQLRKSYISIYSIFSTFSTTKKPSIFFYFLFFRKMEKYLSQNMMRNIYIH